jgi:MobA/MobL family
MAIYHLAAQEFSRGRGDSAVHAAAYRARSALVDERTGLKHDYSRKAGELLFEGIYAPKDAPDWARDRAQLWNHVEAFERHRRAILAREFVIALPHELTLEQARRAVQDWVRDNFTRKGLIADVTIHAPGKDGDERNMHAHVMVVTRKLDGSEFVRTKERFDTYTEKDEARKAELEGLRESWARIGNRHLERYGFEPTLDHRTLEAQGIQREPTVHMGKSATAIEREGKPSELGDLNRAIIAENERKVIDLAAERAMREAHAAARGQVDNIRAGEKDQAERETSQKSREAQGADESVKRTTAHPVETENFKQPETAPEAVQGQYAGAAPSAPATANTRATEPESGAQEYFNHGDELGSEQGFGSRIWRALVEPLASFINYFRAPEPTPTPTPGPASPETTRAADIGAYFRNEAERDRILDAIRRSDAEKDLRVRQGLQEGFAERYGTPPGHDLGPSDDEITRARKIESATAEPEITDAKAAKLAKLARDREETEQSIRDREKEPDRGYDMER